MAGLAGSRIDRVRQSAQHGESCSESHLVAIEFQFLIQPLVSQNPNIERNKHIFSADIPYLRLTVDFGLNPWFRPNQAAFGTTLGGSGQSRFP